MKNILSKLNPFKKKEVDESLTRKERIIKETKSITIIVLVVFGFRSVFFEPFKIPSGSMIPTLMIGDFILVNKMSYGFKVPFSDMFTDPVYMYKSEGPKRGDVVVFKYPKDESINYIKRVVGLPGDTIEIRDKVVYINDNPIVAEPLSGEEVEEIHEDLESKFKPLSLQYFNVKTGDQEHKIILWEDAYYNTNMDPLKIPEGKYFMMGDNRDFSSDSRFWKFVSHRHIKGKAMFVWFNLNLPIFGNEHPFKFRPWRIGTVIE